MTIVLYLVILSLIGLCIFLWWSKSRPDGQIVIKIDSSGKKIFSLELDKGPEEIENMKDVHFKVVSQETNDIAD